MSSLGQPHDFDGRLVDHVLGEGDEATRAAIAEDIGLAVRAGELRVLFDDLRELSTEPTGRVALAVQHAVDRRLQLRGRAIPPLLQLRRVAQIACVAAAVLVAFVLLDRTARRATGRKAPSLEQVAELGRAPDSIDAELVALLDHRSLPVLDATFVACLESFESLPVPSSFDGWVTASHDLAALREQYRLRFAPDERRQMLRSIGAPVLEHRLASLAATVSERIERAITDGSAEVDDLAIGLRAMVAAGSSRSAGPHRDAVAASARELLERLPELEESESASALAALSDLAVFEGGELVEVVGTYTEALARTTLTPERPTRPGLLHWQTPVARLADAGRLLRIAPAFGVHAGLAFRARLMVVAHLDERLAGSEVERPGLVAARLYGFGDLIDRDRAERALMLWRSELLLPDYLALHHVAWSKIPARPGWASFQRVLRALSAQATPGSTADAAALLLSLTMNYAAPGAIDPRSA